MTTSTKSIRVALCDDHVIVREGLKRLIETVPDLLVTGEAGTADEALEMVAQGQPDVLLMDIRLPGKDGVAAIAEIHASFPDVKILALSTFVDDDLIFGAIRAGASGYLAKDVEPGRLFDAIRAVVLDQPIMSEQVVARMVQRIASSGALQPTMGGIERLTPQERVVLRLVAEGLTNQEIANNLCLSIKTVKSHLSNIFGKLDVHNRAQAVAAYLRATRTRDA